MRHTAPRRPARWAHQLGRTLFSRVHADYGAKFNGLAARPRKTPRRKMREGAPPKDDFPANTGRRPQNSHATHHKNPNPGVRIAPTITPSSEGPARRFDALQGTRPAAPRSRASRRPEAGWAWPPFAR